MKTTLKHSSLAFFFITIALFVAVMISTFRVAPASAAPKPTKTPPRTSTTSNRPEADDIRELN